MSIVPSPPLLPYPRSLPRPPDPFEPSLVGGALGCPRTLMVSQGASRPGLDWWLLVLSMDRWEQHTRTSSTPVGTCRPTSQTLFPPVVRWSSGSGRSDCWPEHRPKDEHVVPQSTPPHTTHPSNTHLKHCDRAADFWSPNCERYAKYSVSVDDEAFGYLKRVIVTPAVYPRLVEFLHFDIQSTGQKSHCVSMLEHHHNALF